MPLWEGILTFRILVESIFSDGLNRLIRSFLFLDSGASFISADYFFKNKARKEKPNTISQIALVLQNRLLGFMQIS